MARKVAVIDGVGEFSEVSLYLESGAGEVLKELPLNGRIREPLSRHGLSTAKSIGRPLIRWGYSE